METDGMNQQNVLIDRPLIRPRPCAYLGKNYYFYDNFADGKYDNRVGVAANGFRYQEWTVVTGTWNAANGYLEKTATVGINEYIYTPSTFDVGTWEMNARDTHLAAVTWECYIMNNETSKTATSDGNYVELYPNTNLFRLNRWVDNVHTVIITSAIVGDSADHDLKATRDAASNFEIFYDGVSHGTALDNTVTASSYLVIQNRSLSGRLNELKVHR